MFNDFLETTQIELEDFNPLDAFSSFEDNTTRIYTFTLADSYFVLFTDLLTNSKSDLLKIFEFFEVKIYKSENLFQNSEKIFQNQDKFYDRCYKSNLLEDLNLLTYLRQEEPYRDDSADRFNIFIEQFLNEASQFYNVDNEELSSLIENSLLKKIKHVTVKTAIPFILVSGLVAMYISTASRPERYSYLSSRSSSPFAMIQIPQFSSSSKQLSSTKQIVQSSVVSNVQIPRQTDTVTKDTNKSLQLSQKSLQRHSARDLEVVRRKSLIGSSKTLVASSKRIQISQTDTLYQDANKLVQKVNLVVEKMRSSNRVIRPQLQFGQDLDGTLNGKVNLINSVGMHSTVQDLRAIISNIIKTENLQLTFVNGKQEADHFKPSPQRSSYKMVGKVDTAISTVTQRTQHVTLTNWSNITHSRVDADGKLIPDLSYEKGVTPDRLIDYEEAGKVAAVKSFLQNRYSLSPDTGKLIILDDKVEVNGISGEQLLELEGTSGKEALSTIGLASQLTRVQVVQNMSCNGENNGMEQQLIADCRFFREGHASTCFTFHEFQSAAQAEKNLDLFGRNTQDTILFMENAKALCKQDGPACKEISGLISQVKNSFTTTLTENIYTVENFTVSENQMKYYTDPVLPKDLSRSALDQLGLKNRVFEQDKNRTGAFFNSRKEIKTLKYFPELQNNPLVQGFLEFGKN